MLTISVTKLGHLCKTCVGIYISSFLLATGAVLLVLSLWRGGLNTIAEWLGVSSYPPAILFAAAIMFVIAVLLHYSTVLSRLTDDNVLLAQEVALLRARLDALEQAADRETTARPAG